MELRGLLRKFVGREVRKLPELGLAMIDAAWSGSIASCCGRRQMLALTQIFYELRGHVAGHSSFRSREFWTQPARHGPSRRRCAVASNRDVIDLNYDSCTKRSALLQLKKIFATDIC